MKKLLVLLLLVGVIGFPVVGNCQSEKGQNETKRIMVETEFIELTNNGDTIIQKVIAKPSVAILNNAEARVQMMEKVPIDLQNNKFKDVGLSFSITPTISNESISMKVHWNNSWVNSFLEDIASITEDESNAELFCKNGETVILGRPVKGSNGSMMLMKITPSIIK